MQKPILFVAGHATRSFGKIHEFPNKLLIDDLKNNKTTFIYIRHSIDGLAFSQLINFKDGKEQYTISIPSLKTPSILRYISEVVINIVVMAILFLFTKKRPIAIGIDPLNAFSNVLASYLKINKKNIFYSVDYSEIRFKNKYLNTIYLLIDKLAAKKASQVWNVSSRILKLREIQGVQKERNIFIPNVPSFSHRYQINTSNKQFPTLITLGLIDEQIDFENLFFALKRLEKEKMSIKLKIVGNGPEENRLKELASKLRLNDVVEFCGYLSHKNALLELSKSDIGLALYNGKWSFNYYGDSLKCREFFYFGLPVITTDTHSTTEDLMDYNAGIVVKMGVENYAKAVKKIISKYNYYMNNSSLLGKKYKNIRLNTLEKLL